MRVICRRISQTFQTRSGDVRALEDITFSSGEREFLCFLGPSGCGKSTLLRIIAGLLKPSAGSVTFEGTTSPGCLPTALVFQEHGIFPWMNVIDNACFGLEMRSISRKERYRAAMPLIERMGLSDFVLNYPHQLSSGMKQRVGLARALVSGADVLLMDEPFASVDAQMKLILQEELLEIATTYKKTVIYVTHDIDEAILLGDRIFLLSARPGKIKDEINIGFPRPRDVSIEGTAEYAAIRAQIWNRIKDEVLKCEPGPR
jgi:NitT/TauT family transport system ATP-binding protein